MVWDQSDFLTSFIFFIFFFLSQSAIMLMHCVWLQGQNKIRANAFVWSTHTFAACNSWSAHALPSPVSVMGRTELGCTCPLQPPSRPPASCPAFPHSVYLPLSHRLWGRRCLLPGYRSEWTGHNHDSNVDWTWPRFPSLPRPTAAWVAVWGQASACQRE